MQATGDLIAAAAELAAGVEHRVNDLQSGPSGLGLDVHGDTTTIVSDGDGVARTLIGLSATPPSLWPGRELRKFHCSVPGE